MLVLTRRSGESIVIGNGIKLTIVNIGPGRVKIGIDAPPSVRVDRAEVHERIQCEKAADVLEGIGTHSTTLGADQPTLVVAASDTGVLTNRIADQLPEPPAAVPPSTATPAPTPAKSLNRFRKPR